MSEIQPQSSSNGLKILFVIGILALVGFVAYRFWDGYRKKPSQRTPPTPKKVAQPVSPTPNPRLKQAPVEPPPVRVTPQPSVVSRPSQAPPPPSITPAPTQPPAAVLNFNQLDQNEALKKKMQQRKQAYGVEKGLDMVVKPDETIKIGDTTVPMHEIEEQMRLKRGEIVESDIPGQEDYALTREQRKRLAEQIFQNEKKLAALEGKLQTLDKSESETQYREMKSEYENRRQTARMAEDYRQVVADIHQKNNADADHAEGGDGSEKRLQGLQTQKNRLEKALHKRLSIKDSSRGRTKEYGIYIVRPGDNIWNIHFQVLSGYFEKKGVTLSPLADEPIARGVSSGVGKLLKFSENMVYLYNLENRQLDVNLDELTPYKKIVIYNMKRVFELLDQIDYANVNQIQFDGETIWIIRDS